MAEHLTQNLFVGLGQPDSDSVFLRAYSSLILGDIIELDIERRFFERTGVSIYLDKALNYFEREQDYRAVISPEKGWAFAIPHATDLLVSLASHPQTEAGGLQKILEALSHELKQMNQALFLHNEDERLAVAAVAILHRNVLEPSMIIHWLERLTEAPTWKIEPQESDVAIKYPWWPIYHQSLEAVIGFKNTQTFLRSLYFQLKLGPKTHSLAGIVPMVERAIRRLDTGFLG